MFPTNDEDDDEYRETAYAQNNSPIKANKKWMTKDQMNKADREIKVEQKPLVLESIDSSQMNSV